LSNCQYCYDVNYFKVVTLAKQMKNGESKLYLLNNIMMIDCYYFNKTEENQKQPQHCDRSAGIFTPVQEITVGFVIPYCF
jgi:hypothetical protein